MADTEAGEMKGRTTEVSMRRVILSMTFGSGVVVLSYQPAEKEVEV
jgi:hypothetical protein